MGCAIKGIFISRKYENKSNYQVCKEENDERYIECEKKDEEEAKKKE